MNAGTRRKRSILTGILCGFLLKNDCAECNKPLCIFCAKNQLDLKTTLVVIVVADEQVKKITNTFKPLKKVKGEKGHE